MARAGENQDSETLQETEGAVLAENRNLLSGIVPVKCERGTVKDWLPDLDPKFHWTECRNVNDIPAIVPKWGRDNQRHHFQFVLHSVDSEHIS